MRWCGGEEGWGGGGGGEVRSCIKPPSHCKAKSWSINWLPWCIVLGTQKRWSSSVCDCLMGVYNTHTFTPTTIPLHTHTRTLPHTHTHTHTHTPSHTHTPTLPHTHTHTHTWHTPQAYAPAGPAGRGWLHTRTAAPPAWPVQPGPPRAGECCLGPGHRPVADISIRDTLHFQA